MKSMTESFLHYIWQYRLFKTDNIVTLEGEKVQVVDVGKLNNNAGPDFESAVVRIGQITWAGSVEIHLKSDGWFAHGHDKDPAYNNVILHVVGQSSTGTQSRRTVVNNRGEQIPEIVLNFDDHMQEMHSQLARGGAYTIRCATRFSAISREKREMWLERMVVERMQERLRNIEEQTLSTPNHVADWGQILLTLLARAMGNGTNAEPMERLARLIPASVVAKLNNQTQAEALMLGVAGLLENAEIETHDDDPAEWREYEKTLQREWQLLRVKWQLKPIDPVAWKYARMRPTSFPDIRLVQLASLARRVLELLHEIDVEQLLNPDGRALTDFTKTLHAQPNVYWDVHHRLGRRSKQTRAKRLSNQQITLILVNAVIPFLLSYVRRHGGGDVDGKTEKVLALLHLMPPEDNAITRQWADLGIEPQDDAQSQALIHLTRRYCNEYKCFQCSWGHDVLAHKVEMST